ncbi:hypothetical protein BDN71DRAFT_1428785 [Pleurotus eryngii]|uniref:FAD linked oxidase N-terminal domain-containing protein n=1 Tax=Pleurotus eryngii TaxID=5323 RepID=A0A9P6A2N3_PLEER|nr:hypothetical protein BDN71DRAFT_1428785 [Pleurotus eryngii]
MYSTIKLFKSQGTPVFVPSRPQISCFASRDLNVSFSPSAALVQTNYQRSEIRESVMGISLDLRRMKKVELDMKTPTKTVTFDAGCQWGHVYGTLVDGGRNGFIVNGGRCPTIGVSGFILGGGLGPFTRSFGMGSDTLMEADIVIADGNLALCGTGGGNSGVVVNLKLEVQQLQNRYGIAVAGRYAWPLKTEPASATLFTPDIIATMDDFYATDWPNKITIDNNWMCNIWQGFMDFDSLLPSTAANLNTTGVLPEKSTRFLYETLASQWLEETRGRTPKTGRTSRRFMDSLRADFVSEQVSFLVTWIHSGGKATEKKPAGSEPSSIHISRWSQEGVAPPFPEWEAAFINFPDRDFPDKDNFLSQKKMLRRKRKRMQTDRLAAEQWESYKTTDIMKIPTNWWI